MYIFIVADDTNVSATGGGGGGSSDPTSASDVTYSNSSSGLDADNVQGAIDELADEKLDSAPNGTTDLIDGSGVIDPTYLPDYLLGQVIYGGNVSTNAVATLTTAAQHKLETTDATITLTNDTTAITGYEANEGIYYIADADFTFASMDIKTGDWLISTGTKWSKVDNTDSVTGVKGDSESTYRTGNVNITKADIGLGNVDNTSDLNKPISTATQTALDNIVNGNTVVGKATSDANGNNIANTYQPIIDTDNKLNSDMVDDGDDEPTPLHKFVTQSQKEDIANTKVKVQGIHSSNNNYIEMNNGVRVYISEVAPTGDIPDGSIGIGF